MKLIIAGSRSITDAPAVKAILDEFLKFNTVDEVVSGMAEGVDKIGAAWAIENNIPVKEFIPDWNGKGKAAGIVRNHEMGDYADVLIAFWDSKSKGTADMILYMHNTKKKRVRRIFMDATPRKPVPTKVNRSTDLSEFFE